MAGIPEHIIDQVRDRTDIVEIVSRYVSLKKAGRNYKARCPFHHEKTPSFMVSPAKQIFHCFGCGMGGNVFNFLMKYERLEFPEAVRELAEKAGIEIPVETAAQGERDSLSERLHFINQLAAKYYSESLLRKEGLSMPKRYLEKRGIRQETAERFGLGYAPKSWDGLFEHLKKGGFAQALLEKSGLVIKGKEGKFFDRFRDKIMFPIFDVKGRIKGFGSRVLDNSQPKYMNSPDTFIYNKGNHLYGLHLTWDDIRNRDAVLVVEGYLDLLIPFQHGIKNIVASLGTALTQDQIKLLKRYTNNVVVLFDADQAGENATVRSMDLLLEEDMNVGVAQLPEGHDPDSFIRECGADRFKKMVESAKDLFDYKLSLLLGRYDQRTLEGKAKIASEMLPLISKIKNAIIQSGYLKKLSETLSIEERDLRSELKKVKPDYTYRYRPGETPKDTHLPKFNLAERILTGLIFEDDYYLQRIRESLCCSDFKDTAIRRIIEKLFQLSEAKNKITPGKLIDYFNSDENVSLSLSEAIATCENLVDKRKSMEDCIQWIKQCAFKERLKALCKEIELAQANEDDSKVDDLLAKYNDMIKEVKA